MLRYILSIHITGGLLAIVAAYAALFSPKGGWLHRRAGVLFVAGMLAMGAGAAIVGLAHNTVTWLGGFSTIYWVLTGMRTVRRRGAPTRIDLALTGYAVAIAITSLSLTVKYTLHPTPESLKIPLGVALMGPTLMLLAVNGDLRERRFGPLTGSRRLARHLWRMCYATFVATGSFFLGQAQVIPEPLRYWPVLIVLAVLPLPAMFYWLWRVRRRPVKGARPAPVPLIAPS
jgi:hypothetical protein